MKNYSIKLTMSLVACLFIAGLSIFSSGCKKADPCNQPSTLTTSNVTGTTAQLNWTAASPSPDAYEWQVVPSGNQPGTGTVTSGTVTVTTAAATGLSNVTNYDFYVRSSCDGGSAVSGWAGPGAFTTITGGGIIEPPIYLCDSFGTNLDVDYVLVDRPNAPVDYVIDCVLRVNADLTINPGVVIEMGADAGLYIRNVGSLDAEGTASSPITFRGTTQQAGYWGGIAQQSTSVLNKFSYVNISHAGGDNVIQGGPMASFYNVGGATTFSNNTISNGLNYGIINYPASELKNYSNNTVTTHTLNPVSIHANDFHQLDGTGSNYTGNTVDMIRMTLSPGSNITVTTNQTWANPGVPVIADEGTLGLRAELTLAPGFELVCQQDFDIDVHSSGALNAVGTSANPIVFRGEQSLQGYWIGMYVGSNSVLTKLDYVTVSDAGKEKVFGAAGAKANVYVANGITNFALTNSTISNSLECGVYTSGSTFTMTNITYSNNAVNDVCP